jgi:hypothetical protein
MTRTITSIVAVWVVLMLSTAASTWGLSAPTVNPMVSTISVMAITAIKVGLVLAYFMDLRIAPRACQLAGAVWVIATSSMVLAIYLR